MSAAYQVAPIFLIRLAGVPFDAVEQLATTSAAAIARDLVTAGEECARAAKAAEEFFSSRKQLLAPEVYRELHRAVRSSQVPASFSEKQPHVFEKYADASARLRALNDELETTLQKEVQTARARLLVRSRNFLPGYLLFGAQGVRELLVAELESIGDVPAPRNNAARKMEQSLLLYLQRIAAKNDTFSEFGPSSWGIANESAKGMTLQPQPGIAKREAFLERWTAHALAAAVAHDPEVLPELPVRINPNGVLTTSGFLFLDSGEMVALTADEIVLLGRLQKSGAQPVHAFGESLVRTLIAKKIVLAALEVPALEPFAFEKLATDIKAFRPGAARTRWLSFVETLAPLPEKFAAATAVTARREIMARARQQLTAVGAERKPGQRSLYSAINPIGEECFRQTDFSINRELLDQVATGGEPWIDFWRDSYAYVASRVAAGLQMVLSKAPMKNGALPLPAFLRACEMARVPLTGPGLIGPAMMAFQEIKAAFRQRMQKHAELTEYELTADDCHIVRDNFKFPRFDEFTYPSADLQLAAESAEAIAAGKYQWILSELHPPGALMHHAGYWSCPDKPALNEALASVTGKAFHFGFFAADFTAHTTVRVFDAMPQLTTFVSTQRANPNWRQFPPAQTEVYVAEETGDVRLRHAASREDLGSFARNWIIALGFHPFQFGMKPQMPRLRCGRVIVQRRAWTISANELPAGNFSGISRQLVVAIEKLRSEKQLPRFVYIRPTEEALRRSGAEGRDKDTKPVFVDMESYLFLEIFQRWLTKSGELEVTEMLPAPDDLWWRESDGRRTFELRTLIVPRK